MTQPSLAIHYHRAAYTETTSVVDKAHRQDASPAGLMGREVASNEFLSALLRYGQWSRLDALLAVDNDRQSLADICQSQLHAAPQPRHLRIIPPADHQAWLAQPTSEVLHFPFPPDNRFATQRERTVPHAFAICGVTHTLCSLPAMQCLWQYHGAQWQPYDRLICTSRAVEAMVRDTAAAMQAQVRKRAGQTTEFKPGLEVCPLGVDLEKHRLTRPRDRFEVRRRLGITEDMLVILFTGRLSHHSKAQPYPLFAAAQHVAERIRQEVVILLCGWFGHADVQRAFNRTARRVAPSVRLLTVDGMDPWWRIHAWHAADMFVSLADSIQETFGLTPLEAIARGIPVIASDWNGYRDTIEHQQTGFLIPTTLVLGGNSELSKQLVTGEITYDQFLARVGQTVNVSIGDVCQAMLTLAKDKALRERFASAGRARAERLFGWPSIIAKYESIWETQRYELLKARQKQFTVIVRCETSDDAGTPYDANDQRQELPYPPIEKAFRSYPSRWLGPEEILRKSALSSQILTACLSDPLCNHSLAWVPHAEHLGRILDEMPESVSIGQWRQQLERDAIPARLHSDILGWMCKYGVLTVGQQEDVSEARQAIGDLATQRPLISFAVTCKGRLDDLKHTLPVTTAQPDSTVIVVDYSCPQNAGQWIRQEFPNVRVVSIPDRPIFNRSEAKNAAALAADTDWLCLLDADIVLDSSFVSHITPLLRPRTIIRSDQVVEGTGGTFLCEREMFHFVGGHDPVFCGWGEQDEDLVDALIFAGCCPVYFPAALLRHRHHDDSLRVQFHDERSRSVSHTINRIYRCAKWDWSRIVGSVPPLDARLRLHHQISEQVNRIQQHHVSASVEIDLGSLKWNPLKLPCQRVLQYRLGSPASMSSG